MLHKDDNGDIEAFEIDDLDEVDELRALETEVAEILAADDIAHLGHALENGSTAGVLVWENTWAAPFASAARRSGGQLSPAVGSRSKRSPRRWRPKRPWKESEMPIRPARAARRGVVGAPVARTAAVVGTAKVVSNRRHVGRTVGTTGGLQRLRHTRSSTEPRNPGLLPGLRRVLTSRARQHKSPFEAPVTYRGLAEALGVGPPLHS